MKTTTFDRKALEAALLELIRRASSDLPADVESALQAAHQREARGSTARNALATLLENTAIARAASQPICQDTGTNIYWIDGPTALPEYALRAAIERATRTATKKGYLRPNVVHPVTGANTGDNVGIENPQLHYRQHRGSALVVRLLLKGGGCENVSIQYSLPENRLLAGRDLRGVERCIIDSAFQAQGKGCAPGIFGVGIGGDRVSSYVVAKEALLRPLDDVHPDPAIAALERKALAELNTLEIGPMGFGGRTTALGVKLGIAHRVPASYFVSVAYMCWACRRRTLTFKPNGRFVVE
jgi:fumarate hydratase class I